MIIFDNLWETMKKKGISQYDLYMKHGISKYTLDHLRHNKNIETFTLNKICKVLNCDISDIARYIDEDKC